MVETNSADIIATLVHLKRQVEEQTHTSLRLTILGGAEAHLLASELAEANIGVLLSPPRPLVNNCLCICVTLLTIALMRHMHGIIVERMYIIQI